MVAKAWRAMALCLLAWSTAQAQFVDRGMTTFDPRTSLEWLDLTESNGYSFAEVSAQLQPGGRWAGYRFATALEAQDIFGQVGLPIVVSQEYAGAAAEPVRASIQAFGALFGLNLTNVDGLGYGYSALVGDEVPGAPGFHPLLYAALCCTGAAVHTSLAWEPGPWVIAGPDSDRIVSVVDETVVAYNEQFKGSLAFFLVRPAAAIPEPGTAALVLAGLLVLGAAGWARRSVPPS